MNVLDIENHNVNLCLEETEPGIIVYFDSNLSYEKFFYEHMMKNMPCVIKGINIYSDYKWIADNKPNFDYLLSSFGNTIVPVANCGDKYYNSQKKDEKTLKEYLDYWKTYILRNYPSDLPCLYLKDWHFTRDFPEENLYRVPKPFASDWLNEFFSAREDIKDDYRFVYMGPNGSWTPLHSDVFYSFSWSVNLCGKKRWILFPPGEEKCLVDNHGNLAYDIESPTLKDASKFKNYYKLKQSFEIIQNAGEAIFVPSGWHHQVWNLEDTISINHNWVNGCNIERMWSSLQGNLEAVKLEIADCRDMERWNEHCQIMLNIIYGLDYKQFCEYLLCIVHVRLKHLKEKKYLQVYGNWLIGFNHLKFDITQAQNILRKLLLNEDFTELSYFSEAKEEITRTLEEINIIMDRK